jgi:hypothetical protein
MFLTYCIRSPISSNLLTLVFSKLSSLSLAIRALQKTKLQSQCMVVRALLADGVPDLEG